MTTLVIIILAKAKAREKMIGTRPLQAKAKMIKGKGGKAKNGKDSGKGSGKYKGEGMKLS